MAKSVLSADHFHDEGAALDWIEARLWPNGPGCPKCGETTRVGRLNAKGHKMGMWKCYVCRKPFAVTNKTVMEASHIPLHVWLQGIHLMCTSKKGFSANQLHRTLGITLKSAWFLGHRIREAMKGGGDPIIGSMGGSGQIVEADETWVGGKAANRAYGPIPPKSAVFSLVQRDGGVRSFQVPYVTASNLAPIIAKHVHRDTRAEVTSGDAATLEAAMTRQDALLAMLAAADGREFHPVQIQKAMFLVTEKLPRLVDAGPLFDFIAYDYGAFDREVYAEAENLKRKGLASIRYDETAAHRMYGATPEGIRRGEQILSEMPSGAKDYIQRVAAWVIRLSFSKLVRSMYAAFPWTQKNSVLSGIS